jgi:predicted methyltransferase
VAAVLMVDVYHHLGNRVDYFKKVLFGLKPGGKLMVLEHSPVRCLEKMPPVSIRVTGESVSRELKKAGFFIRGQNDTLLKCHYILTALK